MPAIDIPEEIVNMIRIAQRRLKATGMRDFSDFELRLYAKQLMALRQVGTSLASANVDLNPGVNRMTPRVPTPQVAPRNVYQNVGLYPNPDASNIIPALPPRGTQGEFDFPYSEYEGEVRRV